MKRLLVSLLAAALCLPLAAAAGAVSYTPGPFCFSLPADAEVTALGVYGENIDISGNYNGVSYVLSLSFIPMELGVAEAWEPVIKGLLPVSDGQTVDSYFDSQALYSFNYRIIKNNALYSGGISAGCATGYMSLLCTFTPSEYLAYQALLRQVLKTLALDPSIQPDDTVYVWIANPTGKIYHSTPTCSGMKNPIKISLEDAIKRGIRPCKKCY